MKAPEAADLMRAGETCESAVALPPDAGAGVAPPPEGPAVAAEGVLVDIVVGC